MFLERALRVVVGRVSVYGGFLPDQKDWKPQLRRNALPATMDFVLRRILAVWEYPV